MKKKQRIPQDPLKYGWKAPQLKFDLSKTDKKERETALKQIFDALEPISIEWKERVVQEILRALHEYHYYRERKADLHEEPNMLEAPKRERTKWLKDIAGTADKLAELLERDPSWGDHMLYGFGERGPVTPKDLEELAHAARNPALNIEIGKAQEIRSSFQYLMFLLTYIFEYHTMTLAKLWLDKAEDVPAGQFGKFVSGVCLLGGIHMESSSIETAARRVREQLDSVQVIESENGHPVYVFS